VKNEKPKIEAGRLGLTAVVAVDTTRERSLTAPSPFWAGRGQSPALPWFGLSSRQSRGFHSLREAPDQIFRFSLFIFHFDFPLSTTEPIWV
jgi:hypothetical protein